MKNTLRVSILVITAIIGAISCKKDNNSTTNPPVPPPNVTFSYGDSIFYLSPQTNDYMISPVKVQSGQYIGFPDGIDIDTKTGEINVSKSETGLRYRITFIPDGTNDSISTEIVISGINYLDGFYKLTTADSVLKPLYNASFNNTIPGVNNGTIFDDGSGCNSAGCNVNTIVGTINLAQTVRNGVFGTTPSNNDRHEFDLNYRINDHSGKSLNTLKVKLYYFDSINDVTQEAYDIINSRVGAILGVEPKPTPFQRMTSVNSVAKQTVLLGQQVPKPRPPCIFILGR
ncbi:MAG TPA: hypothetical protein VFI33_15640 [Puia sp.]|nr:hypothetical protein [Puia sp.]